MLLCERRQPGRSLSSKISLLQPLNISHPQNCWFPGTDQSHNWLRWDATWWPASHNYELVFVYILVGVVVSLGALKANNPWGAGKNPLH